MAGFTYWLPTLLLVLILKDTNAVFDPCSELKREIDHVKEMNHVNELLAFQCQEHLKRETHVLEVALRSLKLVEDQFKSELQQNEGVISSLMKHLDVKEQNLKSDKKTQIQLQATIDSLIKTLETQYLKEEEQYGQPKIATPMLHVTLWLQLLVVILIMVWTDSISRFERHTAQRITELENNILEDQKYILKKLLEGKETNNRTIQELREMEKDLKATIDVVAKILQPDVMNTAYCYMTVIQQVAER